MEPDQSSPHWQAIVGDDWPDISPSDWRGLEQVVRTGAAALNIGDAGRARRAFDDVVRASAGLESVKERMRVQQHGPQAFADALSAAADTFGAFADLVYRTRNQILDVVDRADRRIAAIEAEPDDDDAPGDSSDDDSAEEDAAEAADRSARISAEVSAARAEVVDIVRTAVQAINPQELPSLAAIADALGQPSLWGGRHGGGSDAPPRVRRPSEVHQPVIGPVPGFELPHLAPRDLVHLPGLRTIDLPGLLAPLFDGLIEILERPEIVEVDQPIATGPDAPVSTDPAPRAQAPIESSPPPPAAPGQDPVPGGAPVNARPPAPMADPIDRPDHRDSTQPVDRLADHRQPGAGPSDEPAAAGADHRGRGRGVSEAAASRDAASDAGPTVSNDHPDPAELSLLAGAAGSQQDSNDQQSAGPAVLPPPIMATGPAAANPQVPAGAPAASAPSTNQVGASAAADPGRTQAPAPKPGVISAPAAAGGVAPPGVSAPGAGKGQPTAEPGRSAERSAESEANSSDLRAVVGAAMTASAAPAFLLGARVDGDLVLARTLLGGVLAAVDAGAIGVDWAVSVMRHAGGVSAFITSNEGRGWLPSGVYLPREMTTPWMWSVSDGVAWEGVADPARVLAEFAVAWGRKSGARLTALVSAQPIDRRLRGQLGEVALEGSVQPSNTMDMTSSDGGRVDRLELIASPKLLQRVAKVPANGIGPRCLDLALDAHTRVAAGGFTSLEAMGAPQQRERILTTLRRGREVPAEWWEELLDTDDLLAATILPKRFDVARITLGELRSELDGSAAAELRALRSLVFERRCNELVLLAGNPTRQELRDAVYAHGQVVGHPALTEGAGAPGGSGSRGVVRPTISTGPGGRARR